MKKLTSHSLHAFLFLLFCMISFVASAQNITDPLTAKFNKDKPVQILTPTPFPESNIRKSGKKHFKKETDLSKEEIEELFNRIWDKSLWPIAFMPGKSPGWNESKSMMPYYRAYNISDFSVMGYGFVLAYIPYDENQNMPVDFRPPSPKGFFMYASVDDISSNGKERGVTLPLAGSYGMSEQKATASNNSNTINHSTADMSQFLNKSNGTTINNSSNVRNTSDGKYTEAQVYKAEEDLINYLNSSDKILNPLLEKILNSGTDSWILYKTRNDAGLILNKQIATIEIFLKDYGKYTTPSFKAETEARLATTVKTKYKY